MKEWFADQLRDYQRSEDPREWLINYYVTWASLIIPMSEGYYGA